MLERSKIICLPGQHPKKMYANEQNVPNLMHQMVGTQTHLGRLQWKLFGNGQVQSQKHLAGEWVNHLSININHNCRSQS